MLRSDAIEVLRELPWHDHFGVVGCELIPWANAEWVDRAKLGLDAAGRSLLSLFVEGATLSRTMCVSILGSAVLDKLLDRGLLVLQEGGLVRSRYAVIRVDDLCLAVGWAALGHGWGEPAGPWIGGDSVILSRLLNSRSPDAALDVGCGTGILALRAATRGAKVVAIDVSETAVEVAGLNAEINGLSASVEVLQADASRFEPASSFDLVLCNTPFLPIPRGALGWAAAEGGEDCMDVVRDVLALSSSALSPTGEAILVGGGYASDRTLLFMPALRAMLSDLDLTGSLILFKPRAARWTTEVVHRYFAPDEARGVVDSMERNIKRVGATGFVRFILTARCATDGSRVSVSDASGMGI